MYLVSNVSKGPNPHNRNLVSTELLDVIHDQNMKRKFTIIKKGSEVFGVLFLGYGVTISITPLLDVLVSSKNIPVAVL